MKAFLFLFVVPCLWSKSLKNNCNRFHYTCLHNAKSPISHFILPLNVIIFLHWRRINIINKNNANIWFLRYYKFLQSFTIWSKHLNGKNPNDRDHALQRILHCNLFINLVLWNKDYMCAVGTRHAAASGNSYAFCTIMQSVPLVKISHQTRRLNSFQQLHPLPPYHEKCQNTSMWRACCTFQQGILVSQHNIYI